MAFQQIFTITLVVLVVSAVVHSSPTPAEDGEHGVREGRFYGGGGFAGSTASAAATAGAGGYGGLGYPGWGMGLTGSSAHAEAAATSGAFGYGK